MARKVIDMETLEVWKSLEECAKYLGVSRVTICQGINRNGRTRYRRLEYLDYWLSLDSRDKEKYSRKSNIYFL